MKKSMPKFQKLKEYLKGKKNEDSNSVTGQAMEIAPKAVMDADKPDPKKKKSNPFAKKC